MRYFFYIIFCFFIIQNNLFAQKNKLKLYNKLLCYISNDTCVIDKMHLISNSFLLNKWNGQVSVSKYLLTFSTDGFDYFKTVFDSNEITKINDPFSASYDTVDIRKLKCGQNTNSNVIVFFSDIKRGYVNVEIGYSDLAGKVYSRDAYFLSTYLIILYKIKTKSILNISTHIAHN